MLAPSRMSTRIIDWAALAAVLAVALLAAYVLVGNSLRKLEGLEEEQRGLSAELEHLTEVADVVARGETALRTLEAGMQQLDERLPLSMDFEAFYGSLADFAKECDVAIAALQPGEASEIEDYVVMPVSFAAHARYEDFQRFVFQIGNLPRLNTVQQLRIAASETPGLCDIEMTVNLYAANQTETPHEEAD